MGYLDNTTVTIDAILTKKGRELLSKGAPNFNITQFALADDEIDYTLWNPDNPNGSDFYGAVIQNMPLLEAFPDETQSMRYKLVTLPKGVTKIPVIGTAENVVAISLIAGGFIELTPVVVNGAITSIGGVPGTTLDNNILGYTAIIGDNTLVDIVPVGQVPVSTATVPTFIGDRESAQTKSVIGFKFKITRLTPPFAFGRPKQTILTLIGNQTGGQITIPITISSQPFNSTSIA
jgi:hypothetical protein